MIKKHWHGIIAVDEALGIGIQNRLPWPEGDAKWFKRVTKGGLDGNILFGKNTFKSLPVLWDRNVFVFSQHPTPLDLFHSHLRFTNGKAESCEVTVVGHRSQIPNKCWIAGGKQIYDEYLPFCSRVYITRIKGLFDCDVFVNDFTEGFDRHSTVEEAPNYTIELWLNKSI